MLCKAAKNKSNQYIRCSLLSFQNSEYCLFHQNPSCRSDYIDTGNDKFFIENIKNKKKNKLFSGSVIFTRPSINYFENNDNRKNKLDIDESEIIKNIYKTSEDNMYVNILIIKNNDVLMKEIISLVGPVYEDLRLSEDQCDPITLEKYWDDETGERIVSKEIEKIFLFSYYDLNGKIRCLNIKTIKTLIDIDDLVHPVTFEPIPENDIERAKKLIELFSNKTVLFDEVQIDIPKNITVKNRITKLFSQYHGDSINFDENWLLSINESEDFKQIIKKTREIFMNNQYLVHNKTFDYDKQLNEFYKKNNFNDDVEAKEYIVSGWEFINEAIGNKSSPWIIALGMADIVPDILVKFPNIHYMLD